MSGDRFRVRANTSNKIGIAFAQKAEAERVEAGDGRDPVLVGQFAIGGEGR
ncbi:hypothetical protein [Mesorhizobium captivum]|uniref:hypothetical protein n=1 Tax=Mesorhizobium captivum TaxID=3072319 RepID=UPI002A2410D9|nr:hypothetical protein [Mesorhizobium sp. VK3C]MDX8449422.1 hypothetical protein [Mesorhizobium sp. VK3C]